MLRRARAWASAEISRVLHAEVVDARTDLETSLHARVAHVADGLDHEARERERALTASLDRVAAALDAIAMQLAEQARDHRASLAAIEFVAREMALTLIAPAPIATTASTASVVGGTIDPQQIDPYAMDTHAIDAPVIDVSAIDLSDDGTDGALLGLDVGGIVEVRSRFQNRWVDGFEIVEIVDDGGTTRYRLARRADHVHLPVLFDAADLRPLDVVGEIVIEVDIDIGVEDRTDDCTDNGVDRGAIDQAGINRAPDDPGSRR